MRMLTFRRPVAALAVVAMLTPLTACGPTRVKTTPGATVAFYAGKTLEAVKEVQKVVAELEAQHTIPTDKAGAVMIAAYKAGDAGEKLADLAAAYDLAAGAGNASETATLAPRIEALLHTIETAFPKLDLGPNASKIGLLVQAVVEAVAKTRSAVTELRNLARPQASAAWPPIDPECLSRVCGVL